MRRLRDQVAHGFVDIGAYCDGHQFDMMVMSTKEKKKAARYPLLPFMAEQLSGVVELSNRAAHAVNQIIGFPLERAKSRVVSGVLIPALYKLVEVAPHYAKPP